MGVMLSAASCLKWWSDSIHSNVELGNLIQEAEDVQRKSKLIFLPYLMGKGHHTLIQMPEAVFLVWI